MADSAPNGTPVIGPSRDRLAAPAIKGPVRVVITPNEVSNVHGTGPLVERICRGWDNIYSIRARNDWGVEQKFGAWQACLDGRAVERHEFFHEVLRILCGLSVETVLCVPFLREDLLTAIAVQKSFGAKLCVYLMDDQNILTHSLPDDLMREFLECCSLRLTTHPELKLAYENKFGLEFHLLPAIVPDALIARQPTFAPAQHPRRGALVGSFWDQQWFDRLCDALAGCECEIDWFGNNRSKWLEFNPEKLEAAHIRAHGVIAEPQLAEVLKKYPFVIVPAAPLDGPERNPGIARLSLPGRILFAMAASHTPTLILGGENTCAARFVRHFGVGDSAPYDAERIRETMDRISRAEQQVEMRRRAHRLAPLLSDAGVSEWVDASLRFGRPLDSRFADFFAGYDPLPLSDLAEESARAPA